MAIKKSELYSSLWKSCDELRGGMDASQYKDYVLVMLFIKYISDKYTGVKYSPITVPEGASFSDMVKLKGDPHIGDKINKHILRPIGEKNKISDFPDFNDPAKLGSGAEMVKRLTNLIAIFQNPALDFSKNKAEGDDILGDAYEYLMRHFATESGKSKGQFYTPAEVSRIIAKIIGIAPENSTPSTTVYDPTCGSGSLLLKVGDEAEKNISLFGQEMDIATTSLARMNLVLHDHASDLQGIKQGNTLANPQFLDKNNQLQTFDYVVANPPFSFASWTNGVDAANDPYNRFRDYGIPPEKNGDYAFLLHILRSMNRKGKGAVILPHGVLFRGGAEGAIRKNLIGQGYIKGIIGLPANLFYGTGIPACIIVLDKENATNRKAIFMMDASKAFMKDGNKNRLREQDIHRIVDVFNRQEEIKGYSRIVPITEIEQKESNLNIPRYIDNQEAEDVQDIAAHLLGGIPDADIDALKEYWKVYPTLREELFSQLRPGYSALKVEKDKIKSAIFQHPEFTAYAKKTDVVLKKWKEKNAALLKSIDKGVKPKKLIHEVSEDLLGAYSNLKLVDRYDVYQHLMNLWSEVMQDDVYVISADGWEAGSDVYRITKTSKDKSGKEKTTEIEGLEGMESRLLKPHLLVSRYFQKEQKHIDELEAQLEQVKAQLQEMEEEYSGEEGYFAPMEKVNRAAVSKRLKEIDKDKTATDEKKVLEIYLKHTDAQTETAKQIKEAKKNLEEKVWNKYKALSPDETKSLVVDDKWMAALEQEINTELQRISQRLAQRIRELAHRYESPLPALDAEVEALESKVKTHLEKMGFAWS